MTGRKYNFLFIFFPLFTFLFPQKEVLVKFTLGVYAPDPTYALDRCSYGLIVPSNRLGKQEVTDFKYEMKPNHVMKMDEGEYYVKWNNISFAELKKNKLSVTAKVKMFTYDLYSAKKHPQIDKNDLDTLRFLKSEENFRWNSGSVLKVVETFTATTREEVVKSIFEYVGKNMEYCIFSEQDRGAKKALKEGKGDCTEYSELMITLCRGKKIPARIVAGIIPRSNGLVGHHNWVEVFFPDYGWVSFDPTWADGPNANTTFDRMRNAYVQLSYKRFLSVIYCSCSTAQYGFSYGYKDSCVDLANGITVKVNKMVSAYNKDQHEVALSLLDTLLIYESDNTTYWNYKGMVLSRQNKFDEGYLCLQKAMDNSRSNHEKRLALYAYSNHYALKNDKENAVKWLKEAIDSGFENYNFIMADKDLVNLKDHQPFIDLMEQLRLKPSKEKEKKK